jgi:hypothetical protein
MVIIYLVRQKYPEWENQKQVASWRHQLLEALDLVSAFNAKGITLQAVDSVPAGNGDEEREETRRNITDSYIGITSVDFDMADTGSLVMRTRPGKLDPTCSQALICPESVRAFFAAVAKDIVPPQKHFV